MAPKVQRVPLRSRAIAKDEEDRRDEQGISAEEGRPRRFAYPPNLFVVDAKDKTLGRLASQIAHRLKGKHKADYSPHVDMGDHIVVVNAQKIRVTGRKLTDKIYYHHTGYIGGIKSIALEKLKLEDDEQFGVTIVRRP